MTQRRVVSSGAGTAAVELLAGGDGPFSAHHVSAAGGHPHAGAGSPRPRVYGREPRGRDSAPISGGGHRTLSVPRHRATPARTLLSHQLTLENDTDTRLDTAVTSGDT